MAVKFLETLGYEAVECHSEEEARGRVKELVTQRKWPCYFFASDTTGEKDFEEFYTSSESVDWDRYSEIGVVKNELVVDRDQLMDFERTVQSMRLRHSWSKEDLLAAFSSLLPNFAHKETGKTLDNRM
jgi:hypothetical protein